MTRKTARRNNEEILREEMQLSQKAHASLTSILRARDEGRWADELDEWRELVGSLTVRQRGVMCSARQPADD
jgi:hypothetical protein